MKMLVRLLAQAWRWLVASLPNRCIACHQGLSVTESGICRICLSDGLYQQSICLGCGRSMSIVQAYCGGCQADEPIKVIAPCSYHQGLGAWIAAMKYQRQLAILQPLSAALHQRVLLLIQQELITMPQAIVAVPLHSKRLRQRGFNQAWLIAQALSELTGLPLVDDKLIRTVNTQSQAGLDGKQRRDNLSQAFELEDGFPYQRIALVDDVVTTGTTVNEITRLFSKQFVHVQVWCLARAEAPNLLD
ncbi:MAG: ComF family protein [Parashewanella sp.]